MFVYTDDIKLLSSNSSKLPSTLHNIRNWSISWQFSNHFSKSELITFFRKLVVNYLTQYSINGFIIQRIFSVLDFGPTLSFDFKSDICVSKIFVKSIKFVCIIITLLILRINTSLSISSNCTYV